VIEESASASQRVGTLLAPSPLTISPPDLEAIATGVGAGVAEMVAYLDRVKLPSDLQAVLNAWKDEARTETEHKQGQIRALDAELSEKEVLARRRCELEKLKWKAYFAAVAARRQLDGKRAEMEHFLQPALSKLGARVHAQAPEAIRFLEDEVEFMDQVWHRLSTMCLAALMAEHDIEEAAEFHYPNTGHTLILACQGSLKEHLATFRGRTNVAYWSTNNQIAMVSAVRIGEFLGRPVLKIFESTEAVRRRFARPDIGTTLDVPSVIGRLAFGEEAALKTKQSVENLKSLNEVLGEQHEKRPFLVDDMAQTLYRNYEAITKPSTVPSTRAIISWFVRHKWFLLAAGIAVALFVLLFMAFT